MCVRVHDRPVEVLLLCNNPSPPPGDGAEGAAARSHLLTSSFSTVRT